MSVSSSSSTTTHATATSVRVSSAVKTGAGRSAAVGIVSDYTTLRANMLEGQLRPHKVNQPDVLAAFAAVAREEFAVPSARALAYTDAPVAQNESGTRTMFMPMVAARMVQALAVPPGGQVLVLAGGTGYTAAVLAQLGAHVTLQEHDDTLRARAEALLGAGANITIVAGLPTQPAVSQPVQAILIDAGIGELPPAVLNALADGGRLACVREGQSSADGGLLDVTVLTRQGHTVFEEVLFETKATVLPELRRTERFTF